jgi:hypothetical protein
MSAESVRGTARNVFILILYTFIYTDTYKPYCTQLQSKIKRGFQKSFFDACKTIRNRTRTFLQCAIFHVHLCP